MSALTSLALTNVRCFRGTQQVRVPRVALLVGDNSAGKTTFLACYRALAELAELRGLSDKNRFDEPPFGMGSFATIARSGASEFCLEGTFEDHCYERVRVVYDEGLDGNPRERELEVVVAVAQGDSPVLRMSRIEPSDDRGLEKWRVCGPKFEFEFEQSMVSHRQFSSWLSATVKREHLPYGGDVRQWQSQTGLAMDEEGEQFVRFVTFYNNRFPHPAGDCGPVVAANDPAGWRRERSFVSNPLGCGMGEDGLEELQELGRKLGLFENLELRRGPQDRYEIWADASGDLHNVVDVGFGVQSAMPLLQAIDEAPDGATLLLQQPESHLHPSVQARLVELLVRSGRRLVVETHSDHIPKWFVICLQTGKVTPDDLGILYFERSEDLTSSSLFNIGFDEDGNPVGEPPGYRDFFVSETLKFLGIDDP